MAKRVRPHGFDGPPVSKTTHPGTKAVTGATYKCSVCGYQIATAGEPPTQKEIAALGPCGGDGSAADDDGE